MIPSNQQRDDKYRQSPPHVQEAYAGENTGALLRSVFQEHQLREDLYYEYTQAYGDVILGFAQPEDLASLFVERLGLPEPIATHLAQALRSGLPNKDVTQPANSTATTDNAQKPIARPTIAASAAPITAAPIATTTPTWSTAPKPASPTVEAPVPEEKPFYPRVPNYSKPFTTPTSSPTPPTPSAIPPRPTTPPPAPPRANDPYHEPI